MHALLPSRHARRRHAELLTQGQLGQAMLPPPSSECIVRHGATYNRNV